jgi:hypothetical protein
MDKNNITKNVNIRFMTFLLASWLNLKDLKNPGTFSLYIPPLLIILIKFTGS